MRTFFPLISLISALRLVLQEHRQFPFDDGRSLHAVGLLQLANHLRAKEEEAAYQSTSAGEGCWGLRASHRS